MTIDHDDLTGSDLSHVLAERAAMSTATTNEARLLELFDEHDRRTVRRRRVGGVSVFAALVVIGVAAAAFAWQARTRPATPVGPADSSTRSSVDDRTSDRGGLEVTSSLVSTPISAFSGPSRSPDSSSAIAPQAPVSPATSEQALGQSPSPGADNPAAPGAAPSVASSGRDDDVPRTLAGPEQSPGVSPPNQPVVTATVPDGDGQPTRTPPTRGTAAPTVPATIAPPTSMPHVVTASLPDPNGPPTIHPPLGSPRSTLPADRLP